jgi:hypothetical protein
MTRFHDRKALLLLVCVFSFTQNLWAQTPQRATTSSQPLQARVEPNTPTKVASIRTPTSGSTQTWTSTQIAIGVFEQISNEVIIHLINRQTGGVRQVILPNSYIVYSIKLTEMTQISCGRLHRGARNFFGLTRVT